MSDINIFGQDESLRLLDQAQASNIPVLLIGETGTGKSSMVRELGASKKQNVVRFTLTGETTVDEFVGKYTLSGGKTVWQDGVLLQTLKAGDWLVVDELNAALPEILFVLHPLLDDDRFVMVPQNKNEKVTPHPDFRFFATMNPTDEYAGTKELNKAFLSRFPLVLQVRYPDGESEQKAILAKHPKVPVLAVQSMVSIAQAIRKLKAENKILYTCSTRDLIHWAQAYAFFDHLSPEEQIAKSFELTILNRCNGDAPVIAEHAGQILKALAGIAKAGIDDFSPQAIGNRLRILEIATNKNLESIQALDARKEEIAKEVIKGLVKDHS